jgi:hypothetical protein
MNSFRLTIIVESTTFHYTVVENERHFEIEQDGELNAVIQMNEQWEQISGDPLSDFVFDKLIDGIENHYE